MPIYEYRCEKGHTFEVMQRMTDDPLTELRGLRGPGAARLPPGRRALQGLGLLQHRLRQEEDGRCELVAESGSEVLVGGRSPRIVQSVVSSRSSTDSTDSSKESDSPPAASPPTSLPSRAAGRPRRRALLGVRDQDAAARAAAGGLEHLRVARPAGGHVGEQPHQREAVHVGLAASAARSSSPRAAGRTCSATSPGPDRRAAPPAGARRGRGRPRPGRTGSCARARSRARACRRARCSPLREVEAPPEVVERRRADARSCCSP